MREEIVPSELQARLPRMSDKDLLAFWTTVTGNSPLAPILRAELELRGLDTTPPIGEGSEAGNLTIAPEGDFEVLRDKLDVAEAEVLCARLRVDGILAQLGNEGFTRVFSSSIAGGARLLVPANQLPQAREILQGIERGDYLIEQEEEGENKPAGLPPEEQYLAAFAQDDSYLQRWRRKSGLDFHLMAFVFGGFWCCYRKLYGLGIAMIVAEELLLLGIHELWQGNWLERAPSLSPTLTYFGLLLVLFRLPLGLLASRLYRRQALHHIEAQRRQNNSHQALLNSLHKLGGGSLAAAILAVLLRFALRLLLR